MFLGFNSEPRVSIFSLSPASILKVGGLRLLGKTLSSTFWRSISLLLVSYIPILCQLVIWFSPLASFVPRLQSNQTVLLGLPSQDHSFSGSLRRVYQLNPTDFATSLTLLHSFSKSRKILFGVWWKSSVTQQLLCFHHFLDLTINEHISLLGMLGVPLSTVYL